MHSMGSVVHFTINDVTEDLEVVFPSVNLRRIVRDVVAETDIDWDTNFIAILNSIHATFYQFVIEVGSWNRMACHCDLVLLKMLPAAF
ncbi:unnamed protein product [Linum trigynum]|uniref:Uncharacterized protein n=1 Tax=Linum trigynum TaxID=586398 RepID=A0AAV2GJ52_9ROSI